MAKILIVDDAMFMRAAIKSIILAAGHEVVGEAQDGNTAVTLYNKSNPDIVMLDITMPELDGLSALKQIMDADRNARVVMCTALGQENKIKEAIIMGAREYVVKPFTTQKLLEAIDRAML